jgi:putative hydrolase of the HAD superfamily
MKIVIFDLGNVILPFDFLVCCRRLARFGPYSPQQIYKHIFKSPIIYDYEAGKLSSEEFFSRLQRELKLTLDFSSFCPIWKDIFTEDKAVSQVIKRLRNGYRLFLLSNTNELHFEYIYRKFDIIKLFEEYVLSYKVGYMKPDTHIYQEALKLGGIPAEEIVYIDDKPEYAQAATRQGIQGIHFTSASRLEQELISCGISLGPQKLSLPAANCVEASF